MSTWGADPARRHHSGESAQIERTAVAKVNVSRPARRRYVGSRPFDAGDRHLFFGRSAEAAAVFELWAARRLTLLYGPPGCGRTSLIRAAVLPLAAGGRGRLLLPAARVAAPEQAPPAAGRPAAAANPLVHELLRAWSPPDTRQVAAQSLAEFLDQARPHPLMPVFAVLDQVESVFGEESLLAHRRDLLDQIGDAVAGVAGLHLLVSIREDRLPDLDPLGAALAGAGRYRLGPLGPVAALEAVTGPLRGAPQSYAPGAAEEVVHNLRTGPAVSVLGERREAVAGTVEPAQLQAVCAALWQALPAGTQEVTVGHLYGEGDIDGALVRFCEAAVREVAAARQVPESDLWTWLVRTFVTDLGTRDTAYEGVAGVGGMPPAVAGMLADRHLLAAEHRLGSRWYLLASDRLVAPVREGADRWGAGGAATGTNAAASLTAAEGALAAGDLALSARRAAEAARTSGRRDLRTRAAAMSCLGQVAARGGDDREAESHYRAAAVLFEVLQDQAGTGRLLAELGRILLRRGRYAEAVGQLQGAEARLPGDPAVQLDLARALRRSGQLLAATAVLGATLTVAPEAVDALVERGLIRIETEEFSSALEDLDSAARLQPAVGEQAEIRSARAVALARLGRTA
jgi:cytochrome c-type biogenesis protein CcmH/NrfG